MSSSEVNRNMTAKKAGVSRRLLWPRWIFTPSMRCRWRSSCQSIPGKSRISGSRRAIRRLSWGNICRTTSA